MSSEADAYFADLVRKLADLQAHIMKVPGMAIQEIVIHDHDKAEAVAFTTMITAALVQQGYYYTSKEHMPSKFRMFGFERRFLMLLMGIVFSADKRLD